MELAGFFHIRGGEPESDSPSTSPGPAAPSGYSVRLGWIEGAPYIADVDSAEPVLVNSAPIPPRRTFLLRAGDTISLGGIRLSWIAPSERATAVLTREEVGPAAVGRAAAPTVPPEHVKEPPTPGVPTLVVRRAAVAPEVPPPAAAAPPGIDAAGPEAPGAMPAGPPQMGPGETAQIPKEPAPPPRRGPHDATVVIRKADLRAAALAAAAVPSPPPSPPAQAEGGGAQETAWADMPRLIEEGEAFTLDDSPMIRDTQTPHLVIHLGNRTWEALFTKERMTIGRGEDNDIPIPDSFVSRQHATVERRGDAFVIRESQGRNGVWLGRERVQEHTLRDGDVLSLGGAKLVFKGGFTCDELTLIGPPRIDGERRRRPVVVVPGLMGSELWLGSERLWPNPKYILSNPEVFALPGDPRMEARNIVSELVIVPHIVKQRQYSGLGDYLEAGLGYERGKDLLEFAYDWRQDVRLSAQRLGEAIDRWQVKPPVTILAHSLGTLVTRYYVERLGGKRVVERIVLMGGPHYGTPKGLAAVLVGPGLLPFGVGSERMRNVLATFPSAYQILPIYPCIVDHEETTIDPLEDRSWLPEKQRPYLAAARSFRTELGETSSVPAVSIFGYGFKTTLHIRIERQADGQWHRVEFVDETAGDQSVPSGSAVLKDSEIHPVFQEHGALYVDDDVRMRLKVELTRSTTWQRRKY